MNPRELPPTTGGPRTPKPRRCEWCQDAQAVRRVALTTGRKVKAGWKDGVTLMVCPKCEKTIERNRKDQGA